VKIPESMPFRKIVIIGPESTGKSSLSAALAKHFGASWCPEYAREYLLAHGKQYQFHELLTIAKGQLRMEDQYAESLGRFPNNNQSSKSTLFIDTDMYVMKVWCEFVFGNCHLWILDQIVQRKYDLYLLCNTDLPWVQDELREYPDLVTRETLFHIYKDHLVNQNTPWVEIKGQNEERLKMAIRAVDSLQLRMSS
jgi:NadR type nicotinamide-nucleotide adenylyltransferase